MVMTWGWFIIVLTTLKGWCDPTPQRFIPLEAGLHSGYRLQLVWRASLGLWAAVVFRGRPVMQRNFGKCKKFEKYEGNISGGVCTLWMKERERVRKFSMWLSRKMQRQTSFCHSSRFLRCPPLDKGSKHVAKYNVGWWAPTCLQLHLLIGSVFQYHWSKPANFHDFPVWSDKTI